MGKFTIYDDSEVDRQIQNQLDKVVRIIVEAVTSVRSVILYGGFGRGEGSIKLVNGMVTPLHDYDIKVVAKKMPDRKTRAAIRRMIHNELGLSESKQEFYAFSDFVVTVDYTTESRLKLFPDIATYELKVASHLLHGEDIRSLIPWEVNNIPLSSGFRILMEKVTGLIGCFPSAHFFRGETITKHEAELISYNYDKTMVEIACALCLLMRRFEASHSKRAEIFASYYEAAFPELHRSLPDLPNLVLTSTQRKLRGELLDCGGKSKEIMDMWFRCRHYLCTVTQYYADQYLNVRSSDWPDFSNRLSAALQKECFKPLIANFLCQKGIKDNKMIVDMVKRLFPLVSNFQLAVEVLRNKGGLHLRHWLSLPAAELHAIAFLVLLSPDREGLNEDNLKRAYQGLRRRVGLPRLTEELTAEGKWELVRKAYFRFYRFVQSATMY